MSIDAHSGQVHWIPDQPGVVAVVLAASTPAAGMTKWALDLGCIKHDVIVHYTGSGPGGHNIFDIKRARRHHSYLLVFAVPS